MSSPSSNVDDLVQRDILVTACDANYFRYARDLVESIRATGRHDVDVGLVDLGLDDEQRAWLVERGVEVGAPVCLFDLRHMPAEHRGKLGYLARPFLRETFPGRRVYVWLDADAWIQEGSAIDALVAAALADGAAVITEREASYRWWWWLQGWRLKHFIRGYGLLLGLWLFTRAHINSGVFALSFDAPHWRSWQRRYQRAIDRTGIPAPHDQFGLNACVYLDEERTHFLPATYNWICDLAVPQWDNLRRRYCSPRSPHPVVQVLHLAGRAKISEVEVPISQGGVRRNRLTFSGLHAMRGNADDSD